MSIKQIQSLANSLLPLPTGIQGARKETRNAITNEQSFNKIATQLDPLVTILRILGGYRVSKSQKSKHLEPSCLQEGTTCKHETINLDDDGVSWFFRLSKDIFKKDSTKAINCNEECQKPQAPGVQNYFEVATLKLHPIVVLYSCAFKIMTLFCLVTFTCNLFLKFPYPVDVIRMGSIYENLSTASSRTYYNISMTASGILKLMEVILLFVNSNKFVQWLNNWNRFEREYWNCFATSNTAFDFNIRRFRNAFVILYIAIPNALWPIEGSTFMSSMFIFYVPFFSLFLFCVSAYTLWGYALVEDVKVFMIFKTTEMVLKQVRKGISDKFISKRNDLTPEDIVSWRSLIQLIRNQTILACDYLKPQQMMTVTECIIVCSMGVAFFLDSVSNSNLTGWVAVGTLFGTLYYSLNTIGRLYLKAFFADKIPAQELLLAQEILQMDANCHEFAAKTELKFLYTMLTQQTVEVNMGNYFVLNKKLLLHVGVQVVTYLIVILQFQKGSEP